MIKDFKQFINEFELDGELVEDQYKQYMNNGNLIFSNTDLVNLPICPQEWDGMVIVMYNNKLQSLEGLPQIINKPVTIMLNPKLKDLKGSPKIVNSSFNISNNDGLVSLDGVSMECKEFKCIDNGKDFTKKDIIKAGVKSPKITLR